MKKFRSKNHSIDLLFTISLFFVFTITALYVTLAGANLYENTVRQTTSDYTVFTPMAYLEQKLQGYDTQGGISVIQIEDQDILCLHETIDGTAYTTYIYTKDGKLMELFVRDGTSLSLESGTELMDSGTLSIDTSRSRLLTLELKNEDDTRQVLTVHLRAKEG